MLVLICAKYENSPSRTAGVIKEDGYKEVSNIFAVLVLLIINLMGYIDLLDTSVIVFVMIYCGLCFILCYLHSWALGL